MKSSVEAPFIVNMFSQFYKGSSIECNPLNKNLVSQLQEVSKIDSKRGLNPDSHFLEGLKSDTLENRMRWFQKCLGKLVEFLRDAWVWEVVFPYKTQDALSQDWETHYVPAIRKFSKEVSRYKINVIVLNVDQDVSGF